MHFKLRCISEYGGYSRAMCLASLHITNVSLILLCFSVSPDLITKSWDPFPVMGFFVETCQSELNRTGRCLSLPDCRFSRGTREGDCADGFGVCCICECDASVYDGDVGNTDVPSN